MRNMEQVLLLVLIFTSIISCKKTNDQPSESAEKQMISVKWVVDGTSDYKSFEFNSSGNYIIVKKGYNKIYK